MDNEACKVQGSLVFVLRVSRALGLAPLQITSGRAGYTATVSRPAAIYGTIFTLCIHLCGIATILINIFTSKIFPVATVFNTLITVITTGVGCYGGIARMKGFINHSRALYKINNDVNSNDDIKNNKRFLAKFPAVTLIVLTVVFGLTKFFTFSTNKLTLELIILIFNIEYYKTLLIEMENIIINFDVHCVLQTITMKLKHLNNETAHDNVSAATCRSVCQRIHDLTMSYLSICDLVRRLNATRGVIMFMLFSANTLYFMFTVFNLIDILYLYSEEMSLRINICLQLLWCSKYLISFLLLIEPWHLIHDEVTEIQIVLTKLIFNMTLVGKPVPLKLDLMFKQLLLNKPTISPLGMFSVQRSLFIKMISFVTTYNLLLIQIANNRWKK